MNWRDYEAETRADGGEMSKRDKFHSSVIKGLEAEGWIITHDPYLLPYGKQTL